MIERKDVNRIALMLLWEDFIPVEEYLLVPEDINEKVSYGGEAWDRLLNRIESVLDGSYDFSAVDPDGDLPRPIDDATGPEGAD